MSLNTKSFIYKFKVKENYNNINSPEFFSQFGHICACRKTTSKNWAALPYNVIQHHVFLEKMTERFHQMRDQRNQRTEKPSRIHNNVICVHLI